MDYFVLQLNKWLLKESAAPLKFKGCFVLSMPTTLFNHLLLHEVGSSQVSVRFDENKVWITALDEGNPQELFWVLNKVDWDALKSFVDKNFNS